MIIPHSQIQKRKTEHNKWAFDSAQRGGSDFLLLKKNQGPTLCGRKLGFVSKMIRDDVYPVRIPNGVPGF